MSELTDQNWRHGRSIAVIALLVGSVLLGVGLWLGLGEVSAETQISRPVSCGSSWAHEIRGVPWDDYRGFCRDAYGSRAIAGLVSCGVGITVGILGLVGVVMRRASIRPADRNRGGR